MSHLLIILIVSLLSGLSFVAIGYTVFGPAIERQRSAKRRLGVVAGAKRNRAEKASANESAQRRKALQDSLKELEERQKETREKRKQTLSLKMMIDQAGLDIEIKTFWILSVCAGGGFFLATLILGQPIFIAIPVGFVGALGFPRWALGMLRKKRQKKFTDEFANALDVIIRGVKSGLPLGECLQIISREAPKPVCDEFKMLVDGLKVGVDIEQGLDRMYERMPTADVNFFATVLMIQSKTGGNLSEALQNLSNVLRARKQLKAKIDSMSAEAKAGALIIGSLPFVVGFALHMISPDYMNLLFETRIGQLLLVGCAVVMSMGVLVMRQMVNFKV